MRCGFSEQFNTGVVIFEDGDIPTSDFDEVLEVAGRFEAFFNDGEGELIVTQLPGRPVECYTKDALKRSIKIK